MAKNLILNRYQNTFNNAIMKKKSIKGKLLQLPFVVNNLLLGVKFVDTKKTQISGKQWLKWNLEKGIFIEKKRGIFNERKACLMK